MADEKSLIKQPPDSIEQLEKENRKQCDFNEKVINSLEYPFYVVSVTDYKLVLCNKAAQKKGVSVGNYCYRVTHHRETPCTEEHHCPLLEVTKLKKSVITEHTHYDDTGKEYFVEVHGDPVFDENGEVVQMIEYSIDITARKQAEEKLKAAYELLKQTQSQLIQSAKMASLGLLAGGVAHEVNNPLTGVLNNAQLLKMMLEQKNEIPPSDLMEYLEVITESAMRCKSIVSSLLDFAHVSKNTYVPLSINELVEKVENLVKNELNLQNIKIQKELSPNNYKILGDPQLILQVIFDIIVNAKWAVKKKFPSAGGLITLGTSYDQKTGNVCISISDNGIGIPEDNLDKIFEPFFTTKEVGEGTGLGLSIVYSIVKSHKGTIELQSQINQGTTFTIKIPKID
jgi:two-component system, NtrC family, sensor kinase